MKPSFVYATDELRSTNSALSRGCSARRKESKTNSVVFLLLWIMMWKILQSSEHQNLKMVSKLFGPRSRSDRKQLFCGAAPTQMSHQSNYSINRQLKLIWRQLFLTQSNMTYSHCSFRQVLSVAFGCLMSWNIWPVLILLFYYESRQLQNSVSSQIPVVSIFTELPVCSLCLLHNQSNV